VEVTNKTAVITVQNCGVYAS